MSPSAAALYWGRRAPRSPCGGPGGSAAPVPIGRQPGAVQRKVRCHDRAGPRRAGPHRAAPGRTAPGRAGPDRTVDESVGDADGLGATVAELTADDVLPARRGQLLGRLVGQARTRGFGDLFRPRSALGWMVDTIAETAPHVPVRDRATLRRHFSDLDGEALAERLVRDAARASAGVGAAGGGVAAVEWTVPPSLLTAPVLLAAETVAVVAIELKLVGELHEVYGVPLPAGGAQRAVALVVSWSGRRGVSPMKPGVGVSAVLGAAARRELRDRLVRRFGRNLTTLGPFLTGAAVASYLNRRATRGMADLLRADLRRRAGEPSDPP